MCSVDHQLTFECDEKNPDQYLFVVQAVSSAAQIVASFGIGDIARLVGSMKATLIFLIILTFAGNFLYSCASTLTVGCILGGRILCGVASASGALVFSYITATTTDRSKVFKHGSCYRTAAGFFMAISQLVAIFGSYCNFKIGSFKVSSNNAPTFISSFIMVFVAGGLMFVLESPAIPPQKNSMSFQSALYKFFTAERVTLLGSIIVLWGMFLASFIMSEVVYFMPVFLSQSLRWKTEFQGVAFMVASLIGISGSLLLPKIVEHLSERRDGKSQLQSELFSTNMSESLADEKKNHIADLKKDRIFKNQVMLTLACSICVGWPSFRDRSQRDLQGQKAFSHQYRLFFCHWIVDRYVLLQRYGINIARVIF